MNNNEKSENFEQIEVITDGNFKTISTHHFKDKRLTAKAMGLLSFMLALPPYWDFTVIGLTKCMSDGIDSIKSGLKELKDTGYYIREKLTKKDGTFYWKTFVYGSPPINIKKKNTEIQIVEESLIEKPLVEKPLVENPTQLIINECTINKSNINKSKGAISNETASMMINCYTENIELRNALFEFIKIRNLLKKPLTERALKSILNRIDKFSANVVNNKDTYKILLVDQSTRNCWQDIYPLRLNYDQNRSNQNNNERPTMDTWGESNYTSDEKRDIDNFMQKKIENQKKKIGDL